MLTSSSYAPVDTRSAQRALRAHVLGPGRPRAAAPRPPGARQHRLVEPSTPRRPPSRPPSSSGRAGGRRRSWRGPRSYDRAHGRAAAALAGGAPSASSSRSPTPRSASLSMNELLQRAAQSASARSSRSTPRRSCSSSEDGGARRQAAKGIEEEVERGVRSHRHGLRRAHRGDRPAVVIADVDHADVPKPSCATRASARCSARRSGQRPPLGVLHVGSLIRAVHRRRARPPAGRGRPRRAGDQAFAPTSSTACASAVLQRGLLPDRAAGLAPEVSRRPRATAGP